MTEDPLLTQDALFGLLYELRIAAEDMAVGIACVAGFCAGFIAGCALIGAVS